MKRQKYLHTKVLFICLHFPLYHCSLSPSLICWELSVLTLASVFSWAFSNHHQSSEITLIMVTNYLYFPEPNDEFLAHLSWSIVWQYIPFFLVQSWFVSIVLFSLFIASTFTLQWTQVWVINYKVTLTISSLCTNQSSLGHFLLLASKSPNTLFLLLASLTSSYLCWMLFKYLYSQMLYNSVIGTPLFCIVLHTG